MWEPVEDPYTYTGEGWLTGSGAYACTAYDGPTGSYEFTAVEDFCAGTPAAGRIQFVPVSDALLAFENGEIDITSVPADLLSQYQADETLGFVEKANDMGYKLLINFEQCPEFLDIALRQAVYAALDRQAVVDKVFRGAGSVGSAGYVPRTSLYYSPDCVEYDYDPDAARAVLADKNLSVTLAGRRQRQRRGHRGADQDRPGGRRRGGDGGKLRFRHPGQHGQRGGLPVCPGGQRGWGNNPPTYLRTIFSDISKNQGGNPHSMGPIGYENAQITELAEAQKLETDFEARKAIFQELQVLISQEIPLIVIANQSSYSMYRKDVYDGWMKTYAYQQAEQTG